MQMSCYHRRSRNRRNGAPPLAKGRHGRAWRRRRVRRLGSCCGSSESRPDSPRRSWPRPPRLSRRGLAYLEHDGRRPHPDTVRRIVAVLRLAPEDQATFEAAAHTRPAGSSPDVDRAGRRS